EGHLQIDLRELRLAIEAEVLVPKTLDDLEVTLEAAHHVELLEQLGALGEAVEGARVEARRDQEVARSTGREANQDRRLEFPEALGGEEVPRDLRDLVARAEDALHHGAPQIEVAVLQPKLLGGLHLVPDDEGGRLGRVEDEELLGVDL